MSKATEEFAARFNEALDDLGVVAVGKGRHAWVGKTFDISAVAARKWVLGETMPRGDKAALVARKVNVSDSWLYKGNGDKVRKDSASVVDMTILSMAMTAVNEAEQELGVELPMDERAEITAALYKELSDMDALPSKSLINQLVKSASK